MYYTILGFVFGLCFRAFLVRELPFIVLWIAANYTYSQALGHISASAAASVISSNICVVCVLGWLVLNEPFSAVKVSATFGDELYIKYLEQIGKGLINEIVN